MSRRGLAPASAPDGGEVKIVQRSDSGQVTVPVASGSRVQVLVSAPEEAQVETIQHFDGEQFTDPVMAVNLLQGISPNYDSIPGSAM